MRPAEPLCSFFIQLSKSLAASTMADYAHDLLDLAAFLGRLPMPSDVLSAGEDDLVAYRGYCTRDRERPVSAATWKRRRAAINSFYDWAVQTGRLAGWLYFRRGGGRDVLAWGATADLDVRCLTYQQWRLLRQVGLRGLLPGGDADRSFRGTDPLCNCAAAELAVTTGMRLREFSCLLDIEVPPPGRDGLPATVRLQATAKYGLPRDVLIQDATLREIDVYRRTERASVIRRSAAALAWRREELFVVSDVDAAAMRLTGCLHGRRRVFRVEAMPAQLRRITVIEGSRGLEAGKNVAWFTLEQLGTLVRAHRATTPSPRPSPASCARTSPWSMTSGCCPSVPTQPKASTAWPTPHTSAAPSRPARTCTRRRSTS
jgi:hypothetical protein